MNVRTVRRAPVIIGRRSARASDLYLRYEYFGLLRTQGIRWARAAWGFPYRICGWPR